MSVIAEDGRRGTHFLRVSQPVRVGQREAGAPGGDARLGERSQCTYSERRHQTIGRAMNTSISRWPQVMTASPLMAPAQ